MYVCIHKHEKDLGGAIVAEMPTLSAKTWVQVPPVTNEIPTITTV